MTLLIRGGAVYDPAHGEDGVVRDLWIADGRLVSPPTDPRVRPTQIIDATGRVVMPGGVDIHCHVAGPKVNVARKMRPESARLAPAVRKRPGFRSGTAGSTPSSFATGYLYAGLGYTGVLDAAIPPLFARHAHEELADVPVVDKAFLIVMGNHRLALDLIAEGDREGLDAFLGWMVESTGALGIKAVNPGLVEHWKTHRRATLRGIDAELDLPAHGESADRLTSGSAGRLTPRIIIRELSAAAERLGLPHPLHLHANDLGFAGNGATLLETMRTLSGHRAHLAHVQFHSYAGDANDGTGFGSMTAVLAAEFRRQPGLSLDVGQILFGDTVSMTADGPLGHYLHRVTGGRWFSGDTECESGCGVVPMVYRERSLVNAIQWAIGLEWFLLAGDTGRVALSTDHPNGAAFTRYPELIALLMDASLRRDVLKRLPEEVSRRTVLAELDRELGLGEIVSLTRTVPARLMGLAAKGHLGIGADADVTIYQPDSDRRRMFALPRYVIAGGRVIVDDGELIAAPTGSLHRATPTYDAERAENLVRRMADRGSLRPASYPVDISDTTSR